MEVRIRVKTAAKEDGVALLRDGRLAVAVTEQAKAGRANERVIQLVAKHFKVPTKSIRIVRGHTTPNKVLAVSSK